jgi:hypothetical protein
MPVGFDDCNRGALAAMVALTPRYPSIERFKFVGERSHLSNIAAGIAVPEA